MDANLPVLQEWVFPALMRNIHWDTPEEPGRLWLDTPERKWRCYTSLLPWDVIPWGQPEATGFARVIPSVNTANEPIYLLIDFKVDSSLKALYLVHTDLCPIPGVIDQARALVLCILNDGLRELVENALSLPAVNRFFWTCPASIRDHHCYAGGLAQHTVEVATLIVCSRLEAEDMDMALAFALLHDIGKVHAYENGELTDTALTLGHEGIGLNLIQELLDRFRAVDEVRGNTLLELLNGTWKRTTKARRPLAIGRVVNAFDQLSCERNLQRRSKVPFIQNPEVE